MPYMSLAEAARLGWCPETAPHDASAFLIDISTHALIYIGGEPGDTSVTNDASRVCDAGKGKGRGGRALHQYDAYPKQG